MNETNYFDIYSALIRKFGGAKVQIADQEVQQKDRRNREDVGDQKVYKV